MIESILITGGAGFIGSHLADELLAGRYHVRVLDNLAPQVHGPGAKTPDYLNREAEFVYGDVRDRDSVETALKGIDAVFHFAAAVGVGQSMYEINHYTSVNLSGTAVLLEALIKRPVEKLIVASSMSIYGEGLYRAGGEIRHPSGRTLKQLKAGIWELFDGSGVQLEPIPTTEDKTPSLASIYALTKHGQEQMCLVTGRAYGIPTIALRFFNVYGSRQSPSNPYTGVLAIFSTRYLNNNPPLIFEDGLQRRDFVGVRDVAQACRLALEADKAVEGVFNVGSGNASTVAEVAEMLGRVFGNRDVRPVITGKYRVGDIRHCFADISKAKAVLGYHPQVDFQDGLEQLALWTKDQPSTDLVDFATEELNQRGLTI